MATTVMELLSHNASSPDPLHQEVIYKRPLAYQKMENLIKEMQDPEHGVPVRSQKLFLTSIPAAFAGYDVIEWLMERLTIEDSIEAIHLANLLCQHGYFFPVGDNRSLSVKDDSSLYRFQTPYYWPSQVPCLDSVDYAIWLVKRTLRNKQKHGLDDYEIEALNNLRKTLIQKWDFISMQADEQVRISKDRKKVDKMVTDSQERAFWRVLRPPPGLTSCVETPPMHMADFHANEGVKQIRRTNLIEDLRAEVDLLRISCLRSRTKVSQALESLATQCDSYSEHDPFLVARQPSNPWVTDDICFWVLNAPIVEIPTERRVKKWASSMEDLVFDPTGLREFTLYLKKEYCHENIRFWLAVRDLRYGPMSQLRLKAQQIYNEFLSPGAPCEINIDMRTMEAVQKEMNYFTPSRFTFDPAANHVYAMLLKKDCYPRFIRSENYKNLLANAIQPQKKRFFNFSAPIKKKSSATNPMIFPVGSQSATAGVGEVLRVTDEVILLTTGNKPSDFSASHTEPDVALPDVPYRGDIIPEAKNEVDSVTVTKALSQGSFDDVCPWESMEKLPEKDQKMSSSLTTKYDSPTPVTKSLHTITVTKATFIASKHTGSVPAMVGSIAPILQTSTLLPNTSSATSIQATNNKTTPQSASASALLVSPTSISTCTLSNAIEESKGMIGTAMCPNKSEPSSLIARALSVEKQTTNSLDAADLIQDVTILSSPSGFDNSNMEGALGIQGGIKALSSQSSVEKESLPLPLGTSASESSSEQNCGSGLESTANIIVLSKECPTNLNGDGRIHPEHRESLVDVCPWDHENGSQPESTTFTKTYSTLGYL